MGCIDMGKTRMNIIKASVCCLGLLAWAVGQAPAEIITPVGVTASSQFAAAENLINGSGLDKIGLHDNNENNMWQTFSATPIGETVTFELETNYDLSAAIIWQYNGLDGIGIPRPDREIDEMEVFVSPDLVSPFVSVGNIDLAPATDQLAPPGEPAQIFALGALSNVRRVMFEILSLQSVPPDPNVPNPGDVAGLSEVRFEGVPEPATFGALSLCGLMLIGLRRRFV
jgi:hypothetical protein